MLGDFIKVILTRVSTLESLIDLSRFESFGEKHDSTRVTIASERDSSRFTKNRDSSRDIDWSHAITASLKGSFQHLNI